MAKIVAFLAILIFLLENGKAYKIVNLESTQEDQEHRLKVFFSTQVVSVTHTVTSTLTHTDFMTCYAAEEGITECQKKREDVIQEPKVEVNGVETSWESIISPSRVARSAEEIVEEVYPSENVQVVQPDLGEPASVVYPTIVHEPKEEQEEQVVEQPEVRHHEHEQEHEEEEVDNADEHVDDQVDEEEEVTTTEAPILFYETTFAPEVVEDETTIFEDIFEHEEVNPARENEEAPILLESSWEQKDVVIRQKLNKDKCMEMNNDLFINVMSTIVSTLTQYETKTVSSLNTVLFKAEGGCLPSNVDELFTQTC